MIEAARAAELGDLDRIVELQVAATATAAPERGGRVFVAYEAPSDPDRAAKWVGERLAATEAGTAGVWVGTIDEVIVGHAVATTETLTDSTVLARIEALYVEPEARKVAVGEALITAVLDWAGSVGAAGVDAWALPGDRHTKNFFEANGFTARLLTVHKNLS